MNEKNLLKVPWFYCNLEHAEFLAPVLKPLYSVLVMGASIVVYYSAIAVRVLVLSDSLVYGQLIKKVITHFHQGSEGFGFHLCNEKMNIASCNCL